MNLNKLAKDHIKFCKSKGLPVEKKDLPSLIHRIREELNEVDIELDLVMKLEANTDKLQEELVDVLLQTIQALAVIDIDVESAVLKKIKTNEKREWKIK